MNKKLFLIDTTQIPARIGLCSDGEFVLRTLQIETPLTSSLVGAIQTLLQSKNLLPKAITHWGTFVGPGSYTGIRVGLATLMGLSIPWKTPVSGLTLFETMAACFLHATNPQLLLIAQDQGYYAQLIPDPAKILPDPPILSVQESVDLCLQHPPSNLVVLCEDEGGAVCFKDLNIPVHTLSRDTLMHQGFDLLDSREPDSFFPKPFYMGSRYRA